MGEGSTQSIVCDTLVSEDSSANWFLRSLVLETVVPNKCGSVYVAPIRGTNLVLETVVPNKCGSVYVACAEQSSGKGEEMT